MQLYEEGSAGVLDEIEDEHTEIANDTMTALELLRRQFPEAAQVQHLIMQQFFATSYSIERKPSTAMQETCCEVGRGAALLT